MKTTNIISLSFLLLAVLLVSSTVQGRVRSNTQSPPRHGRRRTQQGQILDDWELLEKLNGNDAFDNAGESVAISADGLVYAYGVPDSQFGGHVQVVRRDEADSFIIRQETLLLDAEDWQNGKFGQSIDISENGEYIVVGAPGVSSVQVFAYQNDEGYYEALPNGLVVKDEEDDFGRSVSVVGDPEGQPYFAFGAPRAANGAGKAFVYTYNFGDDALVQVGQEQRGDSTAAPKGLYGSTVEIAFLLGTGLTLAVGAPGTRHDLEGRTYVYDFDYDQYEADPDGYDFQLVFLDRRYQSCGSAIDMSPDGRNLIVGCPSWESDDGYNIGRVYPFFRSGSGTLQLRGSTQNLESLVVSYENEGFGSSVAISDDGQRFVSCFPYADDGPSGGVGHCRVYRYSANGQWTRVDRNTIHGQDNQEFAGDSLATTSDLSTIILGAPSYDFRNGEIGVHKQDSGRVFLFVALEIQK